EGPGAGQHAVGRHHHRARQHLRDIPHPTVRPEHPGRAARRRAGGRGERVPHLSRHRAAAHEADPRHPGRLHLPRHLERLPVAADRPLRREALHAARRPGEPGGRARAGHRVDDGRRGGHGASGADPVPRGPASLHPRHHDGERQGLKRWAWAAVAVALAAAGAGPAGKVAAGLPRTVAAGAPPLAAAAAAPAPSVIDDFEAIGAWSAHPADGVEMRLSTDSGAHGRALRIDFRFVRGGGYAIARPEVSLDLPERYAFSFRVRGDCSPQDLEFKLVDSTGENVWWCNRRGFEYPREWRTLVTKRRQIQFAWGPAGGGDVHHVAAIEIAITAGTGGQGTVWLDD